MVRQGVRVILVIKKKKTQSNQTKNPPKNDIGTLIQPKLDRITLLMDPPNEQEKSQIISAAFNYLPSLEGFTNTSKKNGYKFSGKLKLEASKSQPLLQLIAQDRSKPFFRLEMNPAKLGQSGLIELHSTLISIMDGGLNYLKIHGRISRLDIAIDLLEDEFGITMNDFQFLPVEGLTRRDFSVKGDMETVYLGHPKGNQWRIYRKDKEQQKKKRKIPPTIRIERVLKNPNLKFVDLPALENPFSTSRILALIPSAPPNEKIWQWLIFQDCVKVRGITGALQLLPASRRKIYRGYLNKWNADWWNPNDIWAHWPSVLAQLAILELGS